MKIKSHPGLPKDVIVMGYPEILEAYLQGVVTLEELESKLKVYHIPTGQFLPLEPLLVHLCVALV